MTLTIVFSIKKGQETKKNEVSTFFILYKNRQIDITGREGLEYASKESTCPKLVYIYIYNKVILPKRLQAMS